MLAFHLTTLHPRDDVRIFHKEVCAVRDAGHVVKLIVADGKGSETVDEIPVIDVGGHGLKLVRRFVVSPLRIAKTVLRDDADVIHFHDPELMFVALFLTWRNVRVIYDAHEDVSVQILSKPYIPRVLRRLVSVLFRLVENQIIKRFDVVVAATPSIAKKLQTRHTKAVVVRNLPLLSEASKTLSSHRATGTPSVCYVGGITRTRGAEVMVRAMSLVRSDAVLKLAGSFQERGLRDTLQTLPGWNRVKELGRVDRNGVYDLMSKSFVGLVTLQPTRNYIESLPVKLFEYMNASLPVVSSDFPYLRSIIENADCGICVDPMSPAAIAKAIDYLIDHPARAREMGSNGKRAVIEALNWGKEKRAIVALYQQLEALS